MLSKKLILFPIIFILFVIFFFIIKDNQEFIVNNYTLIDLDSNKIDFIKKEDLLSTNKNKPYLLIFLTTWCDNCLGQAAHLSNIETGFKDKINVYGIFADKNESLDVLKEFAKKSNTNFKWFYKGDISKLVDFYKINTFPSIFLYDKNGVLIMNYNGITPEEMISFDINKILSNQ